MTEQNSNQPDPAQPATPAHVPETQKQRWVKYGANVVLASVVVIVLAVLLTYVAQRSHRRLDTTFAHAYSLKPQTKNILGELKSPIKIYSFYARGDARNATVDAEGREIPQRADYAQVVSDLLDEYKRNSRMVDVESIDPVTNPTKVDDLIQTVTEKYGGEVKKYKQFLTEDYPKQFEELKKLSKEEAASVSGLKEMQLSPELQNTVGLAIITVRGFPQVLEQGSQRIGRLLKQKPPDYKGAVDGVRSTSEQFSAILNQVIEDFNQSKDDKKVPEELRKYMAASLPNYQKIKKLADGLVDEIKNLGEIKLDELRQSLRARNSILVIGEKDMRVLPFEQVWQSDPNTRRYAAAGKEPAPRFAGEQQISAALLSLNAAKKQKVAFVRAGGQPLASSSPFGPAGPLSAVATRLREYNFDVLEKDLTGMWAMQSQAQGMPAAPEPSDADIQDATWVVLLLPNQSSPMGPPSSIAPRVQEHLKNGGSAVILGSPEAENLDIALKEWGVRLRTDLLAVHEKIDTGNSASPRGLVDQARRIPFVFVLSEYGNHMLARPLQSLDLAMVNLSPVQTSPATGYTSSSLLPVPQSPRSWGEKDITATVQQGTVEFNESAGDLPPPIFGGAAVEKIGGNRVVVIGSVYFALNDLLGMPDPEMLQRGQLVAQFPGNGELFLNSVFWAAKMDPLIAISPSAMEVARIGPMSPTAQTAWRVGLLLIGLPALVVLAGVVMYVQRRD